jgi:DNA-directed RNA polymerase subunit RPC12/RpoP
MSAAAHTVTCPHCQRQGRVPEAALGRAVTCPGCRLPFTATDAAPAEPVQVAPAPAAPVVGTMNFPCPTCRQQLSAPETAAGQKVQCVHCGQKILLPESPKPAAQNKTVVATLDPPAPPQAQPPSVPPGLVSVAPDPMPAERPAGPPGWWKSPGAVIGFVAGGLLLFMGVVLLIVFLVSRTQTYTVPGLHDAYRESMRGQRVRVSGRVLLVTPIQTGMVALHDGRVRLEVWAVDWPTIPPGVRPGDEVTIEGEVDRLEPWHGAPAVVIKRPRVVR